jgi:uncharacterized protein YndB with AHSA1/START domain
MTRDINLEAIYPHSIETVWRAITDRDAIAQWLMKNDFEPTLGHKFQFHAKPMGGWDGIVHGEVLEVDPPKKLRYSWRTNVIDTMLTITLQTVAEGTALKLEHSGFRGFKPFMISFLMGSGWKSIIRKGLPAVLGKMDAKEEQAACTDR